MVQAIISNYLKNSDFTTQKQKVAYTASLTVPAGTYNYGQTFSTTISVPSGVYFENVTLSTTLNVGDYYPSNYVVLLEGMDSMIYLAVYQSNSGEYTFQATLMGNGGTPQVTTAGFTANAKIHLSVSPFE